MRSDVVPISVVRSIVKSAIDRALSQSRTPKILAGNVEDIDAETYDVAFVRMDAETMGADPTQSDNWGSPGIIPTTPLGGTAVDEQVRVTFDPTAGASAYRTGIASVGQTVTVDHTSGVIRFFQDGVLVGYLDATQWSIGVEGGLLARLDPLSGLRLRDETDTLRVQLAPTEGLILTHQGTEGTGVILADDGLIVIDPATGDRISVTSGSTSAVPTPHWAGSNSATGGTSHGAPAVTSFGTGDDIDLRFVCTSAPSNLGSQSFTPPAGYTERSDVNDTANGITLATSSATLDPAVAAPGVATFTNTAGGWTRRNGQSVIIRGGGASSPAFRSAATTAVLSTTATRFGFDVTAPTGLADGDLMVAFVCLASSTVPVGWTVPEGWKQLGVQVAGLGAAGTPHVLSSGIWYKRAGASEPGTYHVDVNMAGAGLTKVQTTAHAIQNPYGFPAGLDIRRNNRSMPRGLVVESEEASTALIPHTSAPITITTLTGVSLLAGRSYKVSFRAPAYLFDWGSTTTRFRFTIRRNATIWYHVLSRQVGAAATTEEERNAVYGDKIYVPPADETSSWDVQIQTEVAGSGYFVQVFAPFGLRIEDVGAVF